MHISPNILVPGVSVLFFLAYAALWALGSLYSSYLSGWHLLARRFSTCCEFLGEASRARPFFLDVCMRFWADYSNWIRIAATEKALHLSVTLPLRVGHSPLCIPWNEIEKRKAKFLWRRFLALTLGEHERIPMRISERMASELGILERIQ